MPSPFGLDTKIQKLKILITFALTFNYLKYRFKDILLKEAIVIFQFI